MEPTGHGVYRSHRLVDYSEQLWRPDMNSNQGRCDQNFTRAAAKLHFAQPSLTRQVHNLEEDPGVRLLNRTKSQVALTEEGRSFLADARRILAVATEGVLTVQLLSRGEKGQLNIAYLSTFVSRRLPDCVIQA